MIYGHGKWSFGAFRLAAREAARLFALRDSVSSNRRGSWRPLVLQWRKWRMARAHAATGRAATSPQILWFPQFHFHYATHRNPQARGNRVSGFAPGPSTPEMGSEVNQHWTIVRAATPAQQPTRAYRPLRPFFARRRSRPKLDAAFSAPPLVSHKNASSIAQPILRRQRPLVFGRAPEVVRANRQREEDQQPIQLHTRNWQHWLQVHRVRTPTPVNRVADRSRENKASRVQFDHAEDLVWRRVVRPSTEVLDVEHPEAHSDSIRQQDMRTLQSQEVAKRLAPLEQAEALQITNIDPSLLDRLTDDVIRRVEQRARIERQRRGL